MTDEQLAEALKDLPKGANVLVTWKRPVKLKKAYRNMPFTKLTTMLCRIGVSYDNIQQVQDKRESGELPAANAGLKGFEWIEAPMTLRHIKNGKTYLRLESGTFKSKAKVTYEIDGQIVDFANWDHAIMASERPKEKKEGNLTFNVGAENILAIHNYSIEVDETETEEDGETETT
jgi:hypothetical protein